MTGRQTHFGTVTSVLALLFSGVLPAQNAIRCPAGRAPSGDIGIVSLRCVGPGAACAIYKEGPDGTLRHSFAVEPIITQLTAAAKQSGALQVGDILVALDGRLITTRVGGTYMAQLKSGRDVKVVLRRDGRVLERTVRTATGCGVRSLTVGANSK